MNIYYVTNRGEFGARIKAKTPEEAGEIFLSGKAKYELAGELWREYIEIIDEETGTDYTI
jgi:hypothetical protein